MTEHTVGILLFNEVEVLDFAGPFEVFSVTTLPETNEKPFNVITISEKGEAIIARNGLKIQPDFGFAAHPHLDVVIVPGGYGAEQIEIKNQNVISWIQKQYSEAEFLMSVCTGAFLLARAGILDGQRATTHWMDLDRLEREFPKVSVQRGIKFVDEGSLMTSGGISAGMDLSFHLISKLYGQEIAAQTAKRMEYDILL